MTLIGERSAGVPRSSSRVRKGVCALALVPIWLALHSCAGTRALEPGAGVVWGYVTLVPNAGVEPPTAMGGSYGDRALRDVVLVDYTRPGFVVVYADDQRPSDARSRLAIRRIRTRVRMEPAESIAGIEGEIILTNETSSEHTVSDATAGVIRMLPPGAELRIVDPTPGLHRIRILGAAETGADVFVAPAHSIQVSESGRYELAGLSPGPHRIHAWHPRLPPTVRRIVLPPDRSLRLDLPIGVGVERSGESE